MNEAGKKRLKIALIQNNMNVKQLGQALGIGQNLTYRKIREDRTDFTCRELKAIREILHLSVDEWFSIFFAPDDELGEEKHEQED